MSLFEGCWICDNLHEPQNLIIHKSRTSIAKLNPDQLFRGYTFVTLNWHEENFHNLTPRDQKAFLDHMLQTSQALTKALKPDKMNYELLGNAMPHLHWHLIPRYHTDPMWGRPIWAGNRKRKRLSQDAYLELVENIRASLPNSQRNYQANKNKARTK